jgi:3-oxoadipate enol-lactonase
MPTLNINSITIDYELEGQGLDVVFINGLTMTLAGWAYQMKPFTEGYRVLRYDCRGQGGSDKPDKEYTQELHAEDLSLLLQKLDMDKAHIIGLSNGGMIAQHFALKYPERTGALVLVDTCSYVGKLLELTVHSWIKATEAGGNDLRYDVLLPQIFSENFIENNEALIKNMKEFSSEINSPRAVINLAKASISHDLRSEVSKIKSPTLIIAGEEDILISPKYSKILHDEIENSELVILKDCAHVPPIEKPTEFNSIVLEFLKKHDYTT